MPKSTPPRTTPCSRSPPTKPSCSRSSTPNGALGRSLVARRMADGKFRLEQHQPRYAPHVRPINEMVDGLRDQDGRGWMPHVAPWHGGVQARVLSVLRDPGPKTADDVGSGFLCVENDGGLRSPRPS